MRLFLLLWTVLFLYSVAALNDENRVEKKVLQHRSEKSMDSYKKFLEETCQAEKLTDSDFYWQWEQHEFITSLRVQLLPTTAEGDLTDLLDSPLRKYLPTSPLDQDPRKLRCQRAKKNANLTERLNTKVETSSDFQDYIIDLMFSNPYERFNY